MKKSTKRILISLFAIVIIASMCVSAAAATKYTVVKGDSMWKIAVKYEVGLSEIISANPQIKNPDLIYPGDVLNIPTLDEEVLNFENEVVTLVNNIRVNYGLKPLLINWQLARVARYKSMDMHDNKYFSHTSPTYGSPFDMIRAFNIKFSHAGENIAMGYKSPKDVVDAWMKSPGHKANILNENFTQIGVGYVENGRYWTQMFIG